MNLLDQPKLEKLRIAILNDLKDFIPENHYTRVARYDPKLRAIWDKDLCRYLYEDRDNHPLKYLPRHMATLNLFFHVQSYNSLLIPLSIANFNFFHMSFSLRQTLNVTTTNKYCVIILKSNINRNFICRENIQELKNIYPNYDIAALIAFVLQYIHEIKSRDWAFL